MVAAIAALCVVAFMFLWPLWAEKKRPAADQDRLGTTVFAPLLFLAVLVVIVLARC